MNGFRNTHSEHSTSGMSRRASRGFTLIELLVTIAAVAVLSLGLAQIFAVTGRTVAAGRRLSSLTAAAGVLERQLRDDISKLTREGFLLIRNEESSTKIPSAGSVPDTARVRRLDELVFFVNGQFSSVRLSPLDQRTARASAARVYYGHGLQRTVDDVNDPDAMKLKLDDDNKKAPTFGATSAGNPNRYAGDWILARQLTLLAPPSSAASDKVLGATSSANLDQQIDNAWQIGLQPAAPSIFRNHIPDNEPIAAQMLPWRPATSRPCLASGTIDVAATDLASIRVLMQSSTPPAGATASVANYTAGDGVTAAHDTGTGPGTGVAIQQDWMKLVLPADSSSGYRLRVEQLPPNFLGIHEGNRSAYSSDDVADQLVASQLTLASSAFMPRCSEFIVEWSFGDTDAVGRLLWHGLKRDVFKNGDVRDNNPANIAYTIQQYDQTVDNSFQQFTRRDGSVGFWPNKTDLINPAAPNTTSSGFGGGNNPQLYAYFGFNDPTYSPADKKAYDPNNQGLSALLIDNGRKGVYEPELGDLYNAPETIPWKWPKLLRITMSLVDATDPTIEQTFQFIFSLPERSSSDSL